MSDLSGDSSTATENYVSEQPASYYSKMYEKDNLEGGHVIMLGGDPGSKDAATDALTAWPGHMQLGGGVNTDNARQWLDAGASALIVTSFVFTDGQLQQDRLNSLVRLVGKNRLVLDLSCRKREDGRHALPRVTIGIANALTVTRKLWSTAERERVCVCTRQLLQVLRGD